MKEEKIYIFKDIVFYSLIIGIIIVASIFLVKYIREYYLAEKAYEEIAEEYTDTAKDEATDEDTVDLDTLKGVNKEIIGWIQIPLTRVDYPVVKTSDNDRYLTTDFEGNESIYGCLFMDYRNDGRWTSLISTVYGHNMKNGAMFGSLKKYNSYDYYKEHPIIKVHTFYGLREYEVISSYICTPDDKVYTFMSINSTDDYKDYLKHVKEKASYQTEKNYDINKRSLVLSTCYGKNDRYVVVAQEK